MRAGSMDAGQKRAQRIAKAQLNVHQIGKAGFRGGGRKPRICPKWKVTLPALGRCAQRKDQKPAGQERP